jgi:N4-gp56 family major capsid protein
MVLPVSDNIQFSAQAQPSLALGTSGTQAGIIKDAYDLAFMYELNSMPILRNFVTRSSIAPDHRSHTIVLQKFQYLDVNETTTTAAELDEETDVTPVDVPSPLDIVITATEYGRLITHTQYFEDSAMVPFDQYLVRLLADDAGKTIDEKLQTDIATELLTGDTDGYGLIIVDGGVETRVDSAAYQAAHDALVAGDNITAETVRNRGVSFLENNVLTWDRQNYVCVAHPRVLADLREEAGSAGWRDAKDYMNAPDLKMLPNELGIFEGFRFLSNNRVRTGESTSTDGTYRSYWFGQDALAQHVLRDVTTVIAPQTDGLRRFFGLGWKATLGFAVYEPLAIDVTVSSSGRG